MRDVHAYKNVTLLVVIMQHSTYEDWSRALKTPQKEVKIIMNVVEKYKIDGIQFSNLEPSVKLLPMSLVKTKKPFFFNF